MELRMNETVIEQTLNEWKHIAWMKTHFMIDNTFHELRHISWMKTLFINELVNFYEYV